MIALSIRQPWANMILFAGKNVENREWSTKYRGRVLIHAAKVCTRSEFAQAIEFAEYAIERPIKADLETIPRGGIIGSVEIVDCVTRSDSPWFVGLFGFVLRDPRPLPFTPWKGQLGFFNVPESALTPNDRADRPVPGQGATMNDTDAGTGPVERGVGRLVEQRANDGARCCYCEREDVAWLPEDLRRGKRENGIAVEYHCYTGYCWD